MLSEVLLLTYNLQFFAEEGPGGEKTEEATPKKLEDARKEGQVAKSQELTTAIALVALFAVLRIFTAYISDGFVSCFKLFYGTIETYSVDVFTSDYAMAYLREGMKRTLLIVLPLFAAALLSAVLVNALQVKWHPTAKPLQPKFSKIDPIKGFKRMFSLDKLVDLIKSLLKIAVIGYLVYTTLKDQAGLVTIIYDLNLVSAIMLIGNVAIGLGLKCALVFLVIGVADYIYQRLKFMKDMRMTKQEIKDEFKQTEGDPKIKGQIRQKMREASQRRMMKKLPEADVVITNPTHLACAIKYDKKVAEAPVLIAKGADHLARRIREVAKENHIPIVENKPLARMLYHNVELDEEIPEELYQMTADVLAYVYSLKQK